MLIAPVLYGVYLSRTVLLKPCLAVTDVHIAIQFGRFVAILEIHMTKYCMAALNIGSCPDEIKNTHMVSQL